MESVLGITKELADVFAEESEHDGTFHGFSDHEKGDLNDQITDSENGFETKSEPNLQKKMASSKRQATHSFKLRIVLRSQTSTDHSTEDPTEEDGDEDERKAKNAKKRKHVRFEEEERAVAQSSPFEDSKFNLQDESRKSKKPKKEEPVKFEEEETAVSQPSPFKDSESNLQDESRKSKKAKKGKHVKIEEDPSKDSDSNPEDESFLAKRAQNIKSNKAMLAQLMADLQKMPGGAGLLKKQAAKQAKKKSSNPPRSAGESRRNPERATRRQTRSMGACDSPAPQETELELSLEDELCEVRHAPQRRGAPRPNQSKPHIIRPVSDITEDELQLVADMSTMKVYNRSTGSTCHQCRQKTIDTKTCCRSEECRGVQGQFCGPCLKNRYGEDVKAALLDPEWQCPPCRGICNCSFCRAREGRCPTGILFPLAQYHGFSDVHSYLTSLRNKLKSGEEAEDS